MDRRISRSRNRLKLYHATHAHVHALRMHNLITSHPTSSHLIPSGDNEMTGAGSHCICALLSRPLPRYLPYYSILCAAVYKRAEAALEYWAKPINVFVWWLQSELGTYLPNRCLCAPSVCLIGGIQGLTLILSLSVSRPLIYLHRHHHQNLPTYYCLYSPLRFLLY